MTRTYAAVDTIEPADDTMMEQFGNAATYNVVSGCAVTPDGANLTIDIAAGVITHNGALVTVSAQVNALTLVADATNPRWSWIALNSSGVAVLVSGTAAADPAVPEIGDNVGLVKALIPAGATVASSITYFLDKRIFAPTPSDIAVAYLTADDDTTVTGLADVTGLSRAVVANTTYTFRLLIHYYAAAAADYKFSLTVPASAVIHAMCTYTNTSGTGVTTSITASGSSISANGFGAASPGVIDIAGSLIVAGTAGNLQYQHALVVASGTGYTLTKSRMELY